MKTILSMLLAVWGLYGAGTVQQSVSQLGMTNNWVVAFQWIGDPSDGTVPTTISQLAGCCQGYLITQVEIVPRTPAPTAGYSVAIVDSGGVDALGGQASSLSATVPQAYAASAAAPPIQGAFSLKITGQSVASAMGTVYVFVTKPGTVNLARLSGGGTGSSSTFPLINAKAAVSAGGCGLTMDGVTNDTAALLACISTYSYGGVFPVTIQFPVGVAGICNMIVTNVDASHGNNVSLWGAGRGGDSYPAFQSDPGGATTFKYLSSCPTAGTPFILQYRGTPTWAMTGGEIKGIRLDANNVWQVSSPLILGPYGPRAMAIDNIGVANQSGPAILMQGTTSNGCPTAPRDNHIWDVITNGSGPYHAILKLDYDPCSNHFSMIKGDYGALANAILFTNADSNLLSDIEVIPDSASSGTANVVGAVVSRVTGSFFYPALVGHNIIIHGGYATVQSYQGTNQITLSGSIGPLTGTSWSYDNGLPVTSISVASGVATITTQVAHGVTPAATWGIWINTACTTAVIPTWTCSGTPTVGLSGNFIATSTGTNTATFNVVGVADGTYYSSPLWWSGIHMGETGGGAFNNMFSNVIEDGDGGVTDANTLPGSNLINGITWIYNNNFGFSSAKATGWFIGSSNTGQTFNTRPHVMAIYGYTPYGQLPACTAFPNGSEGEIRYVVDSSSATAGTVPTFSGSTADYHVFVGCQCYTGTCNWTVL